MAVTVMNYASVTTRLVNSHWFSSLLVFVRYLWVSDEVKKRLLIRAISYTIDNILYRLEYKIAVMVALKHPAQ